MTDPKTKLPEAPAALDDAALENAVGGAFPDQSAADHPGGGVITPKNPADFDEENTLW